MDGAAQASGLAWQPVLSRLRSLQGGTRGMVSDFRQRHRAVYEFDEAGCVGRSGVSRAGMVCIAPRSASRAFAA